MKHPVDTSNWGEFKVSELFDCQTTKTMNPNKDGLSEGDIPYVTRSAFNNGISGSYADPTGEFTTKGNCITIGAEGAIAFYQDTDFIAGVKVYTLRHAKLNTLSALFVCSVLNENARRYSYTNARVLDKIKEETIPLPLKPNTNPDNYTQDDIDWYYMESFMSRVQDAAKERLANLPEPGQKSKTPVDVSKWGEFKVGELFETNGNKTFTGAGIPKTKLDSGDTPRITVTDKNNGIIGYYADTDNPNYRTYDKFISVSFLGTVFWHNYRASVDMKVHVLNKLKNRDWTDNIAFFLTSVIKQSIAQFSYSDQLSASKLYDLTIPLPLKHGTNPIDYSQDDIDWGYMEGFMRQIQTLAKNRLGQLTQTQIPNGKTSDEFEVVILRKCFV